MLDHTAFIGRAHECDDVRQLLEQPGCRLLSLVGPGGIGKTRLAIHVGALVSAEFEHGSVVVRLQQGQILHGPDLQQARHPQSGRDGG